MNWESGGGLTGRVQLRLEEVTEMLEPRDLREDCKFKTAAGLSKVADGHMSLRDRIREPVPHNSGQQEHSVAAH